MLEVLKPELPLGDVFGDSFEYWLSVAWAGNGTGGGPLITARTSRLLAMHEIDLGVAFYLEANLSGSNECGAI